MFYVYVYSTKTKAGKLLWCESFENKWDAKRYFKRHAKIPGQRSTLQWDGVSSNEETLQEQHNVCT